MPTLELKGITYKAHLLCADLIRIVDLYHGLHCQAPTNHTKEVGRRSGEEREEVHSGTFAEYQDYIALGSHAITQREKLNGHDGGLLRCRWGDVSLENMFLTRMVRVSAASWQPEIFVERPSGTSQVAASTPSSPNPLA